MFSKKELQIIERLNKRKHLPLPQSSQRAEFDITPYLPIINHPLFQRLKYVRQLANADKVFPGATHTRFLHSIDTAYWQAGRNKFWLDYGMITEDEANVLMVLALLHDIGHGPFSHVLDRVCKVSHDARTTSIITEMENEIKECGVLFSAIVDLFEEKNPLYKSVKHHPLGTDKFSYLTLDARLCGLESPNLSRLPNYVFWLNNELIVHVKCSQEVLELKRFYINMYKQVYLRKGCLIGQRILEKEISSLLKTGKLEESKLWDMTDDELAAHIRRSKQGRYGYDRYQYLKSKSVVTFRLHGHKITENTAQKSLAVFERDIIFFHNLIDNSDTNTLEEKERELAKLLDINPQDLDIVPPMGTHRFIPKPITIINGTEIYRDIDAYPKNHRALKELANDALSMRVCVTKHLRDQIYMKANIIVEFFDDWEEKLDEKAWSEILKKIKEEHKISKK